MFNYLKAVCEDITESPETEKPSYHGAARQTFGSGALRHPDDETFNKIHVEKQEKIRERDQRERDNFDDISSLSHGIIIKQAPAQHIPHKPPGYNPRYVGKTQIIHHTGIHDVVFRPSSSSTRKADPWIYQGIPPSQNNVFLGNDDGYVMGETPLLSSNHQSSGTPEECDATCGPMEFFCSKSCSCIDNYLHCGKIS